MTSFNRKNLNKQNSNIKHFSLVNLQAFPKIYMMISILYIPLIFLYDSKWNTTYKDSNYNKLGPAKIPFLNFYSSFTISPLLTNLIFCTTGLIGIMITISSYLSMKNLFLSISSFISYSTQAQLILYLMLSNLAFLLDFLIGISFLVPNYNEINNTLKSETGFGLAEYAFLVKIGFVVISTVLLLVIYNTNSEVLSNCQNEKDKSVYNHWFTYTLIIIVYLSLLFFVYLSFKAIKEGYVYKISTVNEKSSSKNINNAPVWINKISDYFIALFPYLLHILVGILVYTYSYFLKGCGMCMYQKNEETSLKNNRKFEL